MSLDIDAPGYKFGSKFVKWVDSGWGFRVHCFLTFTRAHTMSLAHWLLPPNSQNRWRRDSFQVQLNNSPLTFQGPWPKVFNFQVLWLKVKLGRLPCTFLCRQDDCLSINSLNRVSGQWNDTFRCEIFSLFLVLELGFPWRTPLLLHSVVLNCLLGGTLFGIQMVNNPVRRGLRNLFTN